MGLPGNSEKLLAGFVTFRGRHGFLCRLPLETASLVPAVRLEVLLPIVARDLCGADIERLLALQQALVLELGWVFSLSTEGWVQLSPAVAIDSPAAVVAAMDLGQALGLRAIDELVADPI